MAWSKSGITYRTEDSGYGWKAQGVGFRVKRTANDWNPREHPRDRRGRFAEKPGGDPSGDIADSAQAGRRVAKKPPAPNARSAPDSEPTMKPKMYTAARQRVINMGFEEDPSQPETVREAVARLRAHREITIPMARDLANAIRGYADRPGFPKNRREASYVTAAHLDSVATEVESRAFPPDKPGAMPKAVKSLSKGELVALVGPGRSVSVVTVQEVTTLSRDRTELKVEHRDGRQESRVLLDETVAYSLPALPPDEEVPPPGPRREHIHPSLLRSGDVLETEQGLATVEEIAQTSRSTWDAFLRHSDGSAQSKRLSPEEGRPSVIRVERGSGSEKQSWDHLMPQENPTLIPPDQVRVGDRVHLPDGPSSARGTVLKIIPAATPEGRSTVLLMNDNGINWTYRANEIVRLVEADANAEARLQQAEERARFYDRASRIAAALNLHQQNARHEVLDSAEKILRGDMPSRANEIRRDTGHQSVNSQAASEIAAALTPGGTLDERGKIERQIWPMLNALAKREYDAVADQVEAFVPLPDETEEYSYFANLRSLRKAKPESRLAEAAATLARWSPSGGLDSRDEEPPSLPELPEGANLRQRIAAYRDFIGGSGENFGKRRVRRSVLRDLSLDDLEAGILPDLEEIEDFAPEKRAADGGPGKATMRQLEALRLAGNEMWWRVEELMEQDWERARQRSLALQDESNAVGEKLVEAMVQQQKAFSSIRDALAKEKGYRNWDALIVAISKAREKGGNGSAQVEKLTLLRDNITNTAEQRMPRDQVDRLEREQKKLFTQLTKSSEGRRETRRRAVLRAISEVRGEPLGGTLKYNVQQREAGDKDKVLRIGDTDREQLERAMRFATESYPASWLAKVDDKYKIKLSSRGYHSDHKKEIALSRGREEIKGATRYGGVAVHELGHAMETNVPGLTKAQEAFLWARTATGEPGTRTRQEPTEIYMDSGEVGWQDDFKSHYTGRYYGAYSAHYEVFTTGYEELAGGKGNYLDDDFRDWLLGVMAIL